MRRILVLNYEFPPLGGGASPVSYELAKRLSETGEFDIDVVTMGFRGLPAFEQINDHFRIWRVRCLRTRKESCSPLEQATYLVSAYFTCVRLIKQRTYDLCHAHFIIPTGLLALALKKRFRLSYIITSHGSDVLGYNKRFEKLYPLARGIWCAVIDNARKVTTPSRFLRDKIISAYPRVTTEKILVIPHGIDIHAVIPQQKKNIIFSSGRLVPHKGFQYLIEAVSHDDLGWEVHIAGDGVMMPELKDLAQSSKTKIIFHGWLDNKGIAYKNLVAQASIFVLVSEAESFGMALLEVMSAGCAVITSDTSGSAEVVGSHGLLVKFGDSDGLRASLKGLIDDREKLLHFQQSALERSRAYGWDAVIGSYKQLYL